MEPLKTQKVTSDQIKRVQDRFKRRMRIKKIIYISIGIFFFIISGVFSGIMAYLYHELPSLSLLEEQRPSVITTIQADNNRVIKEFFVERRIILAQSQIPEIIKQAIIATEDNIFYEHPGIDFAGIMRAFFKNILAGRIVQGGSTITQQLTKILFLTPEQKLVRKIKEAMLALQIEHRYTKDEILTLYLNQIYFGEGAYGIEAAAQIYFDKSVRELDLSEIALLCGLPKAPSIYTPFKNPDLALKRRHAVLKRMLDEKKKTKITREQYEQAVNSPLKLARIKPQKDVAPYFVEEVRKYLDRNYGSQKLYREGLKVVTTLNLNLQKAAETAIQNGLRELTLRHEYKPFRSEQEMMVEWERLKSIYSNLDSVKPGLVTKVGKRSATINVDDRELLLSKHDRDVLIAYRGPLWSVFRKGDYVLVFLPQSTEQKSDNKNNNSVQLFVEPTAEAALICIEVGTGDIKALVGGYSFERSKFNRAIQALRQVGSSFKLFVYLTAIDNGYSPVTIMLDEPFTYYDPQTHKEYSPRNHSQDYMGPVTLTTALAKSINVVAVKLLQQLGIETVIDYATRMGIDSELQPYLSLALGSSEITLAEITNAYAVLPNKGVWKEMKMIKYITDREDELLEQKVGDVRDVVSADVAYVVTNMLEAAVLRGTCWRARSLNRTVAAKTGTTDDYTDAWFIGFSPDLVCGVWVGYDKKRSLGHNETGSRAAGPIWVDFMKNALHYVKDSSFQIPADVILLDIEPNSGLLYRKECNLREVAAFIHGTEPTEYCKSR